MHWSPNVALQYKSPWCAGRGKKTNNYKKRWSLAGSDSFALLDENQIKLMRGRLEDFSALHEVCLYIQNFSVVNYRWKLCSLLNDESWRPFDDLVLRRQPGDRPVALPFSPTPVSAALRQSSLTLLCSAWSKLPQRWNGRAERESEKVSSVSRVKLQTQEIIVATLCHRYSAIAHILATEEPIQNLTSPSDWSEQTNWLSEMLQRWSRKSFFPPKGPKIASWSFTT